MARLVCRIRGPSAVISCRLVGLGDVGDTDHTSAVRTPWGWGFESTSPKENRTTNVCDNLRSVLR
jgi:hypothetical protein